MNDDLFELHVTVHVKDAERVAPIAVELHWKTSQIMGDPVLGPKPFHYLTTYAPTLDAAHVKLTAMRLNLHESGVHLIREKIEHIVHDYRYGEPT